MFESIEEAKISQLRHWLRYPWVYSDTIDLKLAEAELEKILKQRDKETQENLIALQQKLLEITKRTSETKGMTNVTYTYVTPKNSPVSKAEVAGGLVLTIGESRKNNAIGLGGGSIGSCAPKTYGCYALEEAVFIEDNAGSMIRVFPYQIPSLLEALATMLDRGVATESDEAYEGTRDYRKEKQ